MSASYWWGIWREREHSPGRESDDTEILRLTGKHLEARGFQVILKSPDEVIGTIDARPLGVFLMCEQSTILHHLHGKETGRAPVAAPSMAFPWATLSRMCSFTDTRRT